MLLTSIKFYRRIFLKISFLKHGPNDIIYAYLFDGDTRLLRSM